MFHLQIEFLVMNDAYVACKQELERYLIPEYVEFTYYNQNSCLEPANSEAWNADACCNVRYTTIILLMQKRYLTDAIGPLSIHAALDRISLHAFQYIEE